jgi:hypothetical protein
MSYIKTILINVLVLAVALEIGSAVFAYVVYDETYLNKGAIVESVLSSTPAADTAGLELEEANEQHNGGRRIHPFFAFSYDPRVFPSNNFGYPEEADLPYVKDRDEFVIGLFGGSLARSLHAKVAREALVRPLEPALRRKGYREVTLLVLAQGAYKQPQTLFSMLYFIDSIDAAVFLDGFNEIMGLPVPEELASPSQPFDWPHNPLYGALLALSENPDLWTLRNEIAELRSSQQTLTDVTQRGPLGWSMSAHLLWRIMHSRWENEIQALSARMADEVTERGGDPFARIDRTGRSEAEILDSFFERWARQIEMGWLVARDLDMPFFHFVQPNQYVEGSKPLTDQEMRIAVTEWDASRGRRARAYYPHMRQMSADLRARGVPSHDLTMLFEHEPETLYIDPCCHVNLTGRQLIAAAIADTIVASGALERVPTVSERRRLAVQLEEGAPRKGLPRRGRLLP